MLRKLTPAVSNLFLPNFGEFKKIIWQLIHLSGLGVGVRWPPAGLR